jgi:replicative DNA helicase
LLDPAGQESVLDLVQPEDMRRPWHGQVLEAMQRARGRGALPHPAEVYAELWKDPDLPPGISRDGVLVANLMEAAPRASHARTYAAMVIEGSIRQRVHLAGTRIVHAADSGEPGLVLRRAADGARDLDACLIRWEALPGQVRRELYFPGRPAGPTTHASPQASVNPPKVARPNSQAATAAGQQTLRNLAAAPCYLQHVAGWLRPEHFALEEQGELYLLMCEMAARKRAVDPVTISWAAARRGLAFEPEHLDNGIGPLAVATARDVYRHGMLAQATRVGRRIQADSLDASRDPGQLLQLAGDRMRNLQAQPSPWATLDRLIPGMGQALPSERSPKVQREAV